MFNFIPNRLALIVLISACSIILISMGLRQTFGLFFSAFEEGLGCTRTEFGLAIGIQMLQKINQRFVLGPLKLKLHYKQILKQLKIICLGKIYSLLNVP